MLRNFFKKKYKNLDIAPDEIFLDSANLPGFDTDMFEGRIEKPIKKKVGFILGFIFTVLISFFAWQTYALQIINGEDYKNKSQNNLLRHSLIFADRGIIYDRNSVPLVWNEPNLDDKYASNYRKYIEKDGFGHVLGYVKYPQKDSAGFYYDTDISGIEGVEKYFNNLLAGKNGTRIIETDALNNIISDNLISKPEHGQNIYLTIDSEIQEELHLSIQEIVNQVGFSGGAGVIMDIKNGDVIAMTSYPEYKSEIMTEGNKDRVNEYLNDSRNVFLNKITQGLYTPGSIVKPYIAVAALQEKIISPQKEILSTGKLIIPNPWNPDNPSIFTDWKAHGYVNVRKALAVSSNIYFYEVGGGFEDQEGLGIERINKYTKMFGFGKDLQDSFFAGLSGTVPNPDWKKEIFGEDWLLGDTYFTAIGQYGFQVTPIQVVRALSAIANGGYLIEPRIIKKEEENENKIKLEIDSQVLKIVQEGMRQGVLEGTAKGLNYSDFEIAAKTGTAELGITKDNVNSWVTGFFPYENPKYAFVIMLEKGKRTNLIGGVAVARAFFDWVKIYRPDFLQ